MYSEGHLDRLVRDFNEHGYVSLPGFLLLCGYGGSVVQEERRAVAEARQAELVASQAARAEKARLIAVANEESRSLVDQAEGALSAGDIATARSLLLDALGVDLADGDAATDLMARIDNSSNADSIRERLARLTDDELAALETDGTVPEALDFGFDVLTEQATNLAQCEFASARTLRREQAQKAAEAADRERREAAARAEAELRASREKEEADRQRAAAAQIEIQEKLDAYLALLQLAEVTMVERVSVRRSGESWEATLTVANIRHLRHKQIRLQDAQTLWQAWAKLASPNNPDLARISVVDRNGNRVGGSRIWGGSLIWVDD